MSVGGRRRKLLRTARQFLEKALCALHEFDSRNHRRVRRGYSSAIWLEKVSCNGGLPMRVQRSDVGGTQKKALLSRAVIEQRDRFAALPIAHRNFPLPNTTLDGQPISCLQADENVGSGNVRADRNSNFLLGR